MYGIMFWKHWGCILLISLQIHALNAKIKIYFHMFEDFYYRKRNLFILPPRKFCVCNEIRLQLYIKRSTQFDNKTPPPVFEKKILKTKLSCGYLGPLSQLKQRNVLRIFSRESTNGLWTCFMSHSPLDELFNIQQNSWSVARFMCNAFSNTRKVTVFPRGRTLAGCATESNTP